MLNRIHNWLIIKLVGKKQVAINVKIDREKGLIFDEQGLLMVNTVLTNFNKATTIIKYPTYLKA